MIPNLLSPDEETVLRAMVARGASAAKIGAAIGRSEKAVRRQMIRLDLRAPVDRDAALDRVSLNEEMLAARQLREAMAEHLADLQRVHGAPPPDVIPPPADGIKRAFRPPPRGSYLGSPAGMCAEAR